MAVHTGKGAEPEIVRGLGNGSPVIHFRAGEMGHEADSAPGMILLAVSTHGGTTYSRADVLAGVVIRSRGRAVGD